MGNSELKKIKIEKAPGRDDIKQAMTKYMGKEGTDLYIEIALSKQWTT